jgi:hypothetical protein
VITRDRFPGAALIRSQASRERYTPSLPLAMALARYFGVTVEEMFDDQGP